MKFERLLLKNLTLNITDGEHGSVIDDPEGQYYLLSNKNIINGSIVYNHTDRIISKTSFDKIAKRTKLQTNDVVISTVGTIGKVAVIRDKFLKYDFQRSVGIIKCDTQKLLPEYLYYYFNLKYVQKRLTDVSKGAVQKCLFINDLENLLIDCPTNTSDQLDIVQILSKLDQKIDLNNKISDELEAAAQTIFNYWFIELNFPNEKNKPYSFSGGHIEWNEKLKRKIPKNWSVESIEKYITVKDGTHDSPKPTKEGYKLITSKNLKPQGLDFENANYISEADYISINKRSRVDTGDILFSMIGSVGTVYKIEELEIDFAIKNVALYKTSEAEHYKNYIYMYLKSMDMQRYMKNVISGSIQKFIGLGHLRAMPLLFNDSVIRKFSELTKPIFLELENSKRENIRLSQLRDWLLPMLMSGQLKIK